MSKTKKTNKGRRPLYETPEELQAAVDRYFTECEGMPVYDKKGLPVMRRDGRQHRAGETLPTLTGLALSCGFKDRRIFNRQKERSAAFCDVVLGARLRIEDYWEQALMYEDTYYGARYMLIAAFGWGRQDCGTFTQPGKVRIVNRPPKNSDTGSAQASGGDPSIMSTTHIDLLN